MTISPDVYLFIFFAVWIGLTCHLFYKSGLKEGAFEESPYRQRYLPNFYLFLGCILVSSIWLYSLLSRDGHDYLVAVPPTVELLLSFVGATIYALFVSMMLIFFYRIESYTELLDEHGVALVLKALCYASVIYASVFPRLCYQQIGFGLLVLRVRVVSDFIVKRGLYRSKLRRLKAHLSF